MARVRIIKKYPNRRLYDTEISSYVTLEDIRQLVIDDEPFEVHDAKSGQDISRTVLLQIIAEREEAGEPLLSANVLQQLIRFYGDSLQGFMGQYLERSLQVFQDQQHQFRHQLQSLLGQAPWNMMKDLTQRNLEMWKQVQEGFLGRRTGGTEPPPRGGDKPANPDQGNEVRRRRG
ncbi:MAG: polyhydroxyalkanoate synthesis repressor PhaR [Lysobacterales bacterium]